MIVLHDGLNWCLAYSTRDGLDGSRELQAFARRHRLDLFRLIGEGTIYEHYRLWQRERAAALDDGLALCSRAQIHGLICEKRRRAMLPTAMAAGGAA